MVQSQPYKLLNKENKCLFRVSEQVFGEGNLMVLSENSDLLNYLTNQVKLKQRKFQFSRSEPNDLMCNMLYFLCFHHLFILVASMDEQSHIGLNLEPTIILEKLFEKSIKASLSLFRVRLCKAANLFLCSKGKLSSFGQV